MLKTIPHIGLFTYHPVEHTFHDIETGQTWHKDMPSCPAFLRMAFGI